MGLQAMVGAALAPTAQHARLVGYVARQAALGRRVAAVLADPYVTGHAARAGIGDPRALLADPVIAAGVHRALSELTGPVWDDGPAGRYETSYSD